MKRMLRCHGDTEVSEYLLFCVTSSLGPKKQGFWPRNNCSQMKLPNFGSPSSDGSSEIGRHFSNKVV